MKFIPALFALALVTSPIHASMACECDSDCQAACSAGKGENCKCEHCDCAKNKGGKCEKCHKAHGSSKKTKKSETPAH